MLYICSNCLCLVNHIYGVGCSVCDDWRPLKYNYFSVCYHLNWYELKNQFHVNTTSQNSDYAAMVQGLALTVFPAILQYHSDVITAIRSYFSESATYIYTDCNNIHSWRAATIRKLASCSGEPPCHTLYIGQERRKWKTRPNYNLMMTETLLK